MKEIIVSTCGALCDSPIRHIMEEKNMGTDQIRVDPETIKMVHELEFPDYIEIHEIDDDLEVDVFYVDSTDSEYSRTFIYATEEELAAGLSPDRIKAAKKSDMGIRIKKE